MIRIKYYKSHLEKKHIKGLEGKFSELVAKVTAAERKKFISDYNYWKNLSESLAKLSNLKCWYTEVYEIGSYFHVDHFRPKGGLKLKADLKRQNITIPQVLQDEGYWWEAYNWKNYRLSAAKPNSGYKKDYFPILAGTNFWSDRATPNAEVQLLLDPLNEQDCALIGFDSDGMLIPHPHKAIRGSIQEAKVEATIKILGLNDDAFVRARKKEWKFTESIASLADEIHQELLINHPPDILNLLAKVNTILVDILKERVSSSAQFSKLNFWCLVATGKLWIRKEILNLR